MVLMNSVRGIQHHTVRRATDRGVLSFTQASSLSTIGKCSFVIFFSEIRREIRSNFCPATKIIQYFDHPDLIGYSCDKDLIYSCKKSLGFDCSCRLPNQISLRDSGKVMGNCNVPIKHNFYLSKRTNPTQPQCFDQNAERGRHSYSPTEKKTTQKTSGSILAALLHEGQTKSTRSSMSDHTSKSLCTQATETSSKAFVHRQYEDIVSWICAMP